MTTEARFERQLPAILEDLYLGSSPDYRDEVLAAATHTRQRPAWTFPGRWLPMDITTRNIPTVRLPLRQFAIVALLVALLAAALAAYVGSQRRVPAPFGIAKNGLIAYAADGDIHTADPVTGVSRVIVSGPELDRNPRFSRDGLKVAFLRQAGEDANQFHVAVVGREGGEVAILTGAPVGMPDMVDWSPDSLTVVVNTADARLTRYDASGKSAPFVIADGVHVQQSGFRPPSGAQILYQPDGITGTALWLMNADGTDKQSLFEGGSDASGGAISGTAAWSPDGRYIAFGLTGASDTYARIHMMNADGTGLRRLDVEPGVWVDNDLVWSPDSTRIAFNRWREDPGSGTFVIQPIGIVSVDGGPVANAGPAPVSEGASFDWSPDGRSIVSVPGTVVGSLDPVLQKATLIDPAARTSRELNWAIGSATSWQRLAP